MKIILIHSVECFLICTFCLDTQAQLTTKGKDEVESIGSSKLRRQAASLLSDTDVKYAGKKSSRKQIFEQHPGKNDLVFFSSLNRIHMINTELSPLHFRN